MADKVVPPGAMDHVGESERQKWKVEYREPYGRCIIAQERIEEGTVLFSDTPIVSGPKLNSTNTCLGCYKPLKKEQIHNCSRCNWTLCSEACEKKGFHFLECEAFHSANYRFDLSEDNPNKYECILPLRCLMLKTDEKKWKIIESMASHDDLRRKTETWKLEENVCDFLKNVVKVPFSLDEVHRICGVLDVNCHEIRGYDRGEEYRVKGIYPLCAMMSHNCVPNTYHSILDDHSMVMVASRQIEKGHQIFGNYTHLLSGTVERRHHLLAGKFFSCACQRCSDPTEFGTYLSALNCTKTDCHGKVISKDPIRETQSLEYTCNTCDEKICQEKVASLLNEVKTSIKNCPEKDIHKLEELLIRYSKLLSPNHYLLLSIKADIAQMYGRLPGTTMEDLTDEELSKKISFCGEVLQVLDLLSPGISRLRGLLKYEVHRAYLLKINRAFKRKEFTRSKYTSELVKSVACLRNTIYCLQLESRVSFEGMIHQIATKSLEELDKWINSVSVLDDCYFLPEEDNNQMQSAGLCSQDISLGDLLNALE